MIILPQPGSYLAAFEILTLDYRRLLEFVEPTDANASAFSHRSYELFLRVCTEFESACKEALLVRGSTKNPGKMRIDDYKSLESDLNLEAREVGVLTWRPNIKYVHPFDGWTTSQPPVAWYSSYNRVKHNRHTEFAAANLMNLTLGMAGLFLTLAALDVIRHGIAPGVAERVAKGGQARERVYPGHIFTIVC